MKTGFVYIMANKKRGTLYIGVTSDLVNRINQHKSNTIDGFTKTYKIHTLVYYEAGDEIRGSIEREKQLKNWEREWKIQLIEKENPEWNDLYSELIDDVDSESSSE